MKLTMLNCNKVSFETSWDAGARLNEIKKNNKNNVIPQRCYKCDKCGKWHLTKITQLEKNKKDQKRNEIVKKREEIFIKKESEYWENKLLNKKHKNKFKR